MKKLKEEPALLLGFVAAVAAAIVEILSAAEAGPKSAVLIGIPLLTGILIRFGVVPAETVRDLLVRYSSAKDVTDDLSRRLDVAVNDRPGL